jgi:hypothetical protein
MQQDSPQPQALMVSALDHLHAALDALDRADAPGHIGAHVDFAVHELNQALGCGAMSALRKLSGIGDGCDAVSPS